MEGRRRTVEKAVQQLDEEGGVVQEWCEVREEDLRSGETIVTKAGEDFRDFAGSSAAGRSRRREGEREEIVSRDLLREDPSSCPAVGCRRWKEESKLRVDVETGEEVEKSEAFEEVQGGRTRGRRRRRDTHTKMEETEEWATVVDSDSGELREKWQERWFQNGDGDTWGEKQGVNTL